MSMVLSLTEDSRGNAGLLWNSGRKEKGFVSER